MSDHLSEVRRLRNAGKGDTHIATVLGVTRHKARMLIAEAIASSFSTVQPLARIRAPAFLKTVADYTTAISECWQQSVEAIFETGRLLLAAKESLPHGEFVPMIESQLPFGERAAQMLMEIGRDTRIQNRNVISLLPPSWGSIYDLTRLDDPALNRALGSGKIRPDMERKEAQALVRGGPINGARSVMGSRVEPDDSLDYFPTPPWATRALMEYAIGQFPDVWRNLKQTSVWEPACGEGHMSEVLKEYFGEVTSTDVMDYGYQGFNGHLCFIEHEIHIKADWIITNPPFGDKTIPFILRAIELARIGVAMFLRLQILEGQERFEKVFKSHSPTLVSFFSERVPLCKGRWDPDGGTATAYVWLVWLKDRAPMAPFWIPPGQREALTKKDDRARFAGMVDSSRRCRNA